MGHRKLDDAQRLASLLLGTLAGTDSRPEPLRATLCQKGGSSLESFHTFLTSNEVATLIQLPREEVPGYAVHDYVRFDVDFRVPDTLDVPLGFIQQNGRDTEDTFNISIDALTKHAVVIGVTGSGKTTTVMNLIDQVVQVQKPFLVIEPAKTEYRALRSFLAGRADLRIYTLGNEMVAPFRLNPFECEMDEEPGSVSILTHIDFLKAVFNAAFPLYAPMPQVLEEALHEVYEDKGWDLASGLNRRLPDWSERSTYPIFPTLTDLYVKVEVVTKRLGYDKEVENNVKAALKTRVGSLRIGSKGLMLDTARGIPMADLLSVPTILELENIGNDDEKTFIMGLFLARLYEYRRLQAAKGTLSGHFEHLMVFEEAHRLLKNTNTSVDSEGSNMRAQAIEVFTNMLSEVRAYGQGVLVAEQIPSKLAPDVLKNTNLKIVHRLIAQDDRHSIGQTMNLSEEQQTHLGILTPGMAAVYAEGSDHAYLVRLENYKRNITPLTEAELKAMALEYASVKGFQAIPDFERYGVPISPLKGPDPSTFQAARRILDLETSRLTWASLFLCLTTNPAKIFDTLSRFAQLLEKEMPYLSGQQHDAVLRMVVVRGVAETMHEHGAVLGWSYGQVEALRALLTDGLLALVQTQYVSRQIAGDGGAVAIGLAPMVAVGTDLNPPNGRHAPTEEERMQMLEQIQELAEAAQESIDQFTNAYMELSVRQQGPFAGCVHCPMKCVYRIDVGALLQKKERARLDQSLRENIAEMESRHYAGVAKAAQELARTWLGEQWMRPTKGARADEDANAISRVGLQAISYCAALHSVMYTQYSEFEQHTIGEQLRGQVFGV